MGSSPRYPRYHGSRISWGGMLTPAHPQYHYCVHGGVFAANAAQAIFSAVDATYWFNYEFGLVPLAVTHGLRIWQPLTYLFLHDGIWHILFNMLFSVCFGADLERAWGTHRFYVYFFLDRDWRGADQLCWSRPCSTLIGTRLSVAIPTIGASGAIYGVLLAAAIMFPDRQIWLIPFPVHDSHEDLRGGSHRH